MFQDAANDHVGQGVNIKTIGITCTKIEQIIMCQHFSKKT